jgi:protocatechuate 3,4-dioxygenase alpha subunit
MTLRRTPSQTIGPYLAIAMSWPDDGRYVVPEGAAAAFWIRGRVLDGDGKPVDDAVVETWQADQGGTFAAGTRGFGRSMTDLDGRWAVHADKPGPIRRGATLAAPHLTVAVFARGLLKPIWTRIYFGDEREANASDPVLRAVDAARRTTLIAVPTGDGYRFDIRLQGSDETVFFDA